MKAHQIAMIGAATLMVLLQVANLMERFAVRDARIAQLESQLAQCRSR